MTGRQQVYELVMELREVADLLADVTFPDDDFRLYVTLGLQVSNESGDEPRRRALADLLGEGLEGRLETSRYGGSLHAWTRDSEAYGRGYLVAYTGIDTPAAAEAVEAVEASGDGADPAVCLGRDMDCGRALPCPDHPDGADPCAGGCTDPERHAEGGHDA